MPILKTGIMADECFNPSNDGSALPQEGEIKLPRMLRVVLLSSILSTLSTGLTAERLPVALPSEVGMSAGALKKIDEVVIRRFIEGKQLAGASVLVALSLSLSPFCSIGRSLKEPP